MFIIMLGLSLIQQWDDVLTSQRRHLFLSYPDIRPQSLLPWHNKLFEVTNNPLIGVVGKH